MRAEDQVVLATTTYYDVLTNPVQQARFLASLHMAEEAKTHGYPLIVLDGSPLPRIAIELGDRGAMVLRQQTSGMGPSRREVFFYAVQYCYEYGRKIVVWLEAEKWDFIRSVSAFVERLLNGGAHVVLPRRSQLAWDDYNEFQRTTEQEANAVYIEATGLQYADPMFGPMGFSLGVEEHTVVLKSRLPEGVPDTYWQLYAPVLALKADVRVAVSEEIDFHYDPDQKTAENGDPQTNQKRIMQRDTLCNAFRKLAA